jgi:hypothetical protein
MPLETFSPSTTCPKCGGMTLRVRYLPKDCPCKVVGPHLHLHCTTCEYGAGWMEWAVLTMDTPSQKTKPKSN